MERVWSGRLASCKRKVLPGSQTEVGVIGSRPRPNTVVRETSCCFLADQTYLFLFTHSTECFTYYVNLYNLKTEVAATTLQRSYHQHSTLERDKMQLDTYVRKCVVFFYPVIIYSLDLIVFFTKQCLSHESFVQLPRKICMIYVAKGHVQKKEHFSQWLF